MTTLYAPQAASALATLARKGVAVTFTRTSPGVYDAATDTWTTAAATTITGSAIEVRGNPQRYAALELVLATMPTLLFAPTTSGLTAFGTGFVLPGDTVAWGGVTYTVRDVDPVAPDASVILARVVIAR